MLPGCPTPTRPCAADGYADKAACKAVGEAVAALDMDAAGTEAALDAWFQASKVGPGSARCLLLGGAGGEG